MQMSILEKIIRQKVVFQQEWSIGIYRGKTPFDFSQYPINPVISAKDVTDITAKFVADPFLISSNNKYYIFFEAYNNKSQKGEIGLAFSNDCISWKYKNIVLAEDFHLSYPLVFYYDGHYYMIPETACDNSVRLYKAKIFPYEWTYVTKLLDGAPYKDSTIFYYKNTWWLYARCEIKNLDLYYSHNLISNNWIKHQCSPIYSGEFTRPAGKVLFYGNEIFRFAQNLYPVYGTSIMAYRVISLSPTLYIEEEYDKNPFLSATGKHWNSKSMHHIDFYKRAPNDWILIADGYSEDLEFRPKILFQIFYSKLYGFFKKSR